MNIIVPIVGLRDLPEATLITVFKNTRKGVFPRVPEIALGREAEWEEGWVALAEDYFAPVPPSVHPTIAQLRSIPHEGGECDDPHMYGDTNAIYQVMREFPHPPGANPCSCLAHITNLRAIKAINANLDGCLKVDHPTLSRYQGTNAVIRFPDFDTLWAEFFQHIKVNGETTWRISTEADLEEASRSKDFKSKKGMDQEPEDEDAMADESLFKHVTRAGHLILIVSPGTTVKNADRLVQQTISTRKLKGLKTWLCVGVEAQLPFAVNAEVNGWAQPVLPSLVRS